MGAYNSHFVVHKSQIVKGIKPTNPNWMLRHAELLELPISEVARCWKRFLQLGANRKGVLTRNDFLQQNSEMDKFLHQIFLQLPWSSKGTLTFQVFLKVCKWFDGADEIVKLKVVYGILNRNKPLDVALIQRILKNVYPNETTNLAEIAKHFIQQVDYKKQFVIDEEEFISFAKSIPFDEIKDLLHFQIFPEELNPDNSEQLVANQ